MSASHSKTLFLSCLLTFLLAHPVWGQQTTNQSPYPSGPAGTYVQDGSGWHPLAPASPAKIKAKHAFLSGLSYGAVAAPVVAQYSGAHAKVVVNTARPRICVFHVITPNAPSLVRLQIKKKARELDTGHIRASPVGSTHMAVADSNIVVPTTTSQPEDGVILLEPEVDLAPGEYAVMFGANNMAIMDFGVNAGSK